jgi:hypothetical protein
VHWASSSHYYNGTTPDPTQNPAVAAMRAANMHAVAVPAWDAWAEIHAHETQHFRRFRNYVNQFWPRFQSRVDSIGLSMLTYRTKADVLASDRLAELLELSIRELSRGANEAMTDQGGFADHTPPDGFYGCSLGGLSAAFGLIDAERTAHGCPIPSRSGPSCPN